MAAARSTETELILQAQEDLQSFIDYLKPQQLDSLALHTGASFTRLNLLGNKDIRLEKNNSYIQEIVFCLPHEIKKEYTTINYCTQTLEGHYCILTIENKPTLWSISELELDPKLKLNLAHLFIELLMKVKGGRELALTRPETSGKIAWEKQYVYNTVVESFYTRIRPLLASRIFDGSEIKDTGKKIHLYGLGCGEGHDLQVFKDHYPTRIAHITGIDICEKSLRLAQRNFNGKFSNITFVLGNCTQLSNLVTSKKTE